MTTDVWIVRNSQRYDFVEEIKQRLRDELAKTNDYDAAQIALCMALTESIAQARKILPPVFTIPPKFRKNPVRKFLREKILPSLIEFAHTPEEAQALIADLLEWSSNSIVGRARAPLLTQEVENSKKVPREREDEEKG
jgi:hypothetical protein